MKLKHTPGPWMVWKSNGNFDTVICLDKNNSSGTAIAFTVFRGDVNNPEANARLIAAAPDMLEALIIIADELKKNNEPRGEINRIIESATGLSIEEVLS